MYTSTSLPAYAGYLAQSSCLNPTLKRTKLTHSDTGNVSLLNKLAAEHNAKAIIHTGDFGFFGTSSLASPPPFSPIMPLQNAAHFQESAIEL